MQKQHAMLPSGAAELHSAPDMTLPTTGALRRTVASTCVAELHSTASGVLRFSVPCCPVAAASA